MSYIQNHLFYFIFAVTNCYWNGGGRVAFKSDWAMYKLFAQPLSILRPRTRYMRACCPNKWRLQAYPTILLQEFFWTQSSHLQGIVTWWFPCRLDTIQVWPGGNHNIESLQFGIICGNICSRCLGIQWSMSIYLTFAFHIKWDVVYLILKWNETYLNSHKSAMTMAMTDAPTPLMILPEAHVEMVFLSFLSPHCVWQCLGHSPSCVLFIDPLIGTLLLCVHKLLRLLSVYWSFCDLIYT